MKKSNLITGILYVLFGVVCLIVALLIETKLEGILWGFAGAGIFPGIMMIAETIRIKPKMQKSFFFIAGSPLEYCF